MTVARALAALIGGGIKGYDMRLEDERQKNDQDFKLKQRAAWETEQKAKDDERAMLKTAGAPVSMATIAGGQQGVDMFNDKTMGPPAEAPTQPLDLGAPLAYQVGTKTFSNQALAQKELSAQNSPEAVNQRIAQGYRSLGQVEKAMALEASDRQAQLATMELAKNKFQNLLGKAMWQGHDGIAALGSQVESGPFAGKQFGVDVSPDGKTATYFFAGQDGAKTTVGTFSNDQAGVIKAASMFDPMITPEMRLKHVTDQEEKARQQGNWQAEHNLALKQFDQNVRNADRNYGVSVAQLGIQQQSANRQDQLSGLQLEKGGIELDNLRADTKIPSAVKLQVDSAKEAIKLMDTQIYKHMAENNGQVPKQLMEERDAKAVELSKLLSPYMKPPAATPAVTPTANQFIAQVLPDARRVAEKHGVPVEAVVAQWGLETGWGKSVIPGTNNLGNIKDFSGRGVAATDNMTGSRDKYRQYANQGAFADDFSNLIGNARYKGAVGAKDPRTYFSGLKQGGYAEDPDYVAKGVAASAMAAKAIQAMSQQAAPAPAPETLKPPVMAAAVPPAAPKPSGKPAQSAPPAEPPSKTEVAGQALDAARAAFAKIRSERAPGLAAGPEARAAYAQRLQDAKDEIRKAEAAYQAVLPTQTAAAFRSPVMASAVSPAMVR